MWEVLVVVAVIAGFAWIYNSLVKLREQAAAAWADIEVQLKRRYDLIPNLVRTVKGYAGHEKETLESVIQARSSAMGAQGPVAKAQAEGVLAGALKSLFALAEAYPDLEAAGGFRDLQAKKPDATTTQWSGTSIPRLGRSLRTWSPACSTSGKRSSSKRSRRRRRSRRWTSAVTGRNRAHTAIP
jgi:hypothetical protein